MQGSDTLVFAGQARLPQSLTSGERGGVVLVDLVVDASELRVVDVGCTGLSPTVQQLLRDILVSTRLDEGIEPRLAAVERRYHGVARKAICTAVTHAYETYLRWRHRGD
jgi:hypothetical protein